MRPTTDPMKPGDHPEFFRFPAPAGRTRESTIFLDRFGRFWHDDSPVERRSMARAFSKWITRHPDDGRYILSSGHDWTYFTVEDVPFFIEAVRIEGDSVAASLVLALSDDSFETLDPKGMRVGAQDALYVQVKGGVFQARFMQSAQTALAPLLVEGVAPEQVGLKLGGTVHSIPLRKISESAKRPP